ncbi:hypothetical protein F5Y08DRAFT_341681 [Xylaria arbuscula]|nr:hypothetical protein F5Y08DRAFT_341681 [Xylaria arbuscula]
MTENAGNILSLTRGIVGENPYSNMMIGIARCPVHEKPDLKFEIVDVEVDAAAGAGPASSQTTETQDLKELSSEK